MRNITTGSLIILYGFFNGGSVFLGNPTAVDWAFDTVGVGLILLGLWKVYQSRQQ
ncbi:MAG: hypothetical protein U0931_35535 [Vulcanimicrobiota bacterium]